MCGKGRRNRSFFMFVWPFQKHNGVVSYNSFVALVTKQKLFSKVLNWSHSLLTYNPLTIPVNYLFDWSATDQSIGDKQNINYTIMNDHWFFGGLKLSVTLCKIMAYFLIWIFVPSPPWTLYLIILNCTLYFKNIDKSIK